MKSRWAIRVDTVFRLGFGNVLVVLLYRLALKLRLLEIILKKGGGYTDPLFCLPPVNPLQNLAALSTPAFIDQADEILNGKFPYFSHHQLDLGTPPNWFQNPFNGLKVIDCCLHWSRGSEFGFSIGDIKQIWEPSRFDWALILARAFRCTENPRYFHGLTSWAADWTTKNPANTGPNWKCGQETGLRMLQVLLCAQILDQFHTPTSGLVRFVAEHCARIEPTLHYALAQENNHGTSEAAALFVGGSWLQKVSKNSNLIQRAERWAGKGRYWLENRLNRLVGNDGSFSQNSLNYHRVLLDTLNMVEFWRRKMQLEPFSDRFYLRSASATEWLFQMVDGVSGDGPNLGANDGARLFALSSTLYRDYRPTVQLGGVLFLGGRLYPVGPWDEALGWLGLNDQHHPRADIRQTSREFQDGGYCIVRSPGLGNSWGMLRFPRYRFRPSHCDGLHFDLWHRGVNILRDSGTYSYHADEPWQSYFPSTRAHNTIEFHGRDQMLRLGRFLLGAWLEMDRHEDLSTSNGRQRVAVAYRDYEGCRHKRTLMQENSLWRVVDEIDSEQPGAALRWRLAPGQWEFNGERLVGENAELLIHCNQPIIKIHLIDGWESRHYLEKSKIPVLEVLVATMPAVITTDIYLH